MVIKRECEEPDAEQQPAAEEPAAKRPRANPTGVPSGQDEDKSVISDHSMPLQLPNATMALQAAAELPKAAAEVPEYCSRAAEVPATHLFLGRTHAEKQVDLVNHAQAWCKYWHGVVQRERMQLSAHLDGQRRVQDLHLEEVKNKNGVVIGHVDPDPDIDRLHIRMYLPDKERYICFLDCKMEDNFAKLKKKIQEHPDVMAWADTFEDLKVFYNGCEMCDTDTLEEKWIDDDCILHAVDTVYDAPAWVAKSSAELFQWKRLLFLKPPDRNKEAEKVLKHRFQAGQMLSGARPAAWLSKSGDKLPQSLSGGC